jgi:hypothetical protein
VCEGGDEFRKPVLGDVGWFAVGQVACVPAEPMEAETLAERTLTGDRLKIYCLQNAET